MGLAAEVSLDHASDQRQSGRVGGVLQGMEDRRTCSVGQIQFAGGIGREIVADDPIDFGPEGLDCD